MGDMYNQKGTLRAQTSAKELIRQLTLTTPSRPMVRQNCIAHTQVPPKVLGC